MELNDILSAIFGGLGVHTYQEVRSRLGWTKCPDKDCGFKIQSNQKTFRDKVMEDHIRTFHTPKVGN